MLEDNEFEELSKQTYLIGCLRSYAQWLGVDSVPLIVRLKHEINLPGNTQQKLSSVKVVQSTSKEAFVLPKRTHIIVSIICIVVVWSVVSAYQRHAQVAISSQPEEIVVENENIDLDTITEYILVAMEPVKIEILDELYQQQKVWELNAGETVFFKHGSANSAFVSASLPNAVEVFLNNDNSDYVNMLKDMDFFFTVKTDK
jgi:hypothetical protein